MQGQSPITIDKIKLPAKLAIIHLMSQLANLNPIQESAFYRDKVTCGSGAQLETERKSPTNIFFILTNLLQILLKITCWAKIIAEEKLLEKLSSQLVAADTIFFSSRA